MEFKKKNQVKLSFSENGVEGICLSFGKFVKHQLFLKIGAIFHLNENLT